MLVAQPMSTRRALLKVGYRCNNNCVFCHAAPHRGHDAGTDELKRKIVQASRLGADCLVLSGGEATIRPDLLRLAETVVEAGMDLGLVSNGRMLSYGSLLDELMARRFRYLHLTLASPDPDLHDQMVQAPAFEQSMKALVQAHSMGVEITLNMLVSRPALPSLLRSVELLEVCRPSYLKFSLIEPEGPVLEDFDALVPNLDEAAHACREAMEKIHDSYPEQLVVQDAFPACFVESGTMQRGLREEGFAWMTEAFEADWHPIDEDHRDFAPPCDACSWRRRCRGVYRSYLTRRGHAELKPRLEAVSNSFNLAPLTEPEAFELKRCPIRQGLRPTVDPVREILMQVERGVAQRHRVLGEDFSDPSLRLARETGRLMLDLSGGGFLENLAQEVRPLLQAKACRRCALAPLCGGLWKPGPRDGFGRAKSLLAERLAGLKGRVLDVGCGGLPYLDAIKPGLEAGDLFWLGLEPAEIITADLPNLRLVKSSLEDFEPASADLPFDAICLLRSINHLAEPDLELARLFAWLRPGGRLFLADDACFGVLRSAAGMTALKERKAPAYEHHHCLELDEARRLALAAGLVERESLDHLQTASSMWILDLLRPD